MNALTDATGVRDLEMPARPERVWSALRKEEAPGIHWNTRPDRSHRLRAPCRQFVEGDLQH